MSEKQREAPQQDELVHPPQMHQPPPQHGPPPVQQQNLGNVQRDTDQRVGQALSRSDSLQSRLPDENLTQNARVLVDWASQTRELRIGERDYGPQAQVIGDLARQAIETGDPALLSKAQGLCFVLIFGSNAQMRADQSGSQDARELSNSLQKGWTMFGTDQGMERISYSIVGTRNFLDNPQIYNAPGNEEARRSLLQSVARLSDPSVQMGREEIAQAFQSIQQTFMVASARVSDNVALQNISTMIQTLMGSDVVRVKMKDQMDKLMGDLAGAWSKLADSKKDKEEKEKELSELEKKAEKMVASVMELALAEAGAPAELIAVVRGAGKLLESKTAILRARGQQLINLGMTFLQNKKLMLADKPLLNKLVSAAKMVAGGMHAPKKVSETVASLHKDIGKILGSLAKAKTKNAEALGQLGKAAEGMLADIDKLGSKPLREAAARLLGSIQDKLKGGGEVAEEYLRGVAETLGFLKGSLASLLRLPAKTDKEKAERGESADLVAMAVDSAMKDAKSEVTTLLKFISGLHMGSVDSGIKSFLSKLGQALAGGKVKPEEAKKQIAERFVKEGEAAEAALRKESPKIADTFASNMKPLKGGKTDLGSLAKANEALGIAGFVLGKVIPHKNDKVKGGVLSIMEKSLSALEAGNMEAAMQGASFAGQLVEAPEEKAIEAINLYDAESAKALEQAKDALRFERKALLELMPSMPKEFQSRIEKTLGEIDRMLEGPMDEAKLNSLLLKLRETRRMGEDIQKTESFELKKSLTELYCLALDKLDTGEREQYAALMLAAKELKSNAAFNFEAGSYRKGIMEQVNAMKDPAKAAEAMGKLLSFIGQSLTKKLQDAGKNLDESAQKILSQVKAGADAASLECARAALEVAKSMNDFLNSPAGKRLEKEKRDGAAAIYERALQGAVSGIDPSVIGAQKFLAEKYVAGDEAQGAELDALSARIADDPNAIADVETYIQVNDRLAAANAQRKALPKDSPLRAPLEDVVKELARVRGMIARGEDLVGDEKAASYEGQVTEMMKDPAVSSQVEALAQDIRSRNEGMGTEEAMALALKETARSVAMVAERERLKGLLALADQIGKAGPRPDPRLAGLFALSAKAYLKGDAEKGMLFSGAAGAALANPAELGRISDIAAGMDAGKVPLEQGMFVLGMIQQRSELEKKISDKGLLANAAAYFDLAEMSAMNGDIAGAQEIRQMAIAYAATAAVKESSLDKDGRKLRSDSLGSIEKALGDYKAKARVRDMKGGEALNPVAEAVLSKKPLREALGAEGFSGLQSESAARTKSAFLLSRSSDFDDLMGRNPAQAKAIDERWDAERKRLQALADQHRKAGRNALAEYYDAKAAEADRAVAKDAVAKARGMLENAASHIEKAEKLKDEADALLAEAGAAKDPAEKAKLEDQAKAKYGEAAKARQEAERLGLAASGIDESLTSLDVSVRQVNTINRERGRFQLGIALRTNLALGLGHSADLLGNVREKEGEPVPLAGGEDAALYRQASAMLDTGKRAVAVQQQIMRSRDSGLASAKASLHDANLNKAKELISKLANMDPATAKAKMEEAQKLIDAGDMDGLQKHYFLLASQQGVKLAFTDTDGELRTAFDPLENEKKYQQVVGLYWGERFSEAGALSRAARFDMDSKAFIAGVKIDDVRLTRQFRAALPPESERKKVGGFPVGAGGWADPRNHHLLKQVIAHMDPKEREKFNEKLDKIPNNPDGDIQRQMLFDELSSFRYHGNWPGGKDLAEKIMDGDLIYFDADSLIGKAVSARGFAAEGKFGAADVSLESVRGEYDVAVGMQEADIERVTFDYAEYDYNRRGHKAPKEFLPEEIPISDESESGTEKKKNLDARIAAGKSRLRLEPAVKELQNQLFARAKANAYASKLALQSRDAIKESGGKMRLDEGVMLSLASNLLVSGQVTDPEAKKLLSAIEAEAPGSKAQSEKLADMWNYMCTKNPDLLVFAVQKAQDDPSFSDSELIQLRAFSGGLLTKSRNYEWDASIEPMVTKRLQTAIALHQRAAIMGDKDEQRKLYELADHPIGTAKSLARDGYGWMKEPERMKKMLENDEWVNNEAFKLLFAKSDLDELGKRFKSEDFSKMKTDFQLWLSGFRRKDDGTLERFQMTPAEYKRIADAYAQFIHMENDMLMKAGIGVWESDEYMYMARIQKRSRGFYESAEMIVFNPGGRFLSTVLAESEKKFEQAIPVQERKGKLYDPDFETLKWTKTKQDWQAAADIGKGLLKMAAYSAGFALAPVTGGASAYIAGGIAATEGFIGAADYLESCGGDLGAMSGEEQAYFFFQVGIATASAVAPVVGELAQAKNAARLVQIGMGAERALAPTAIEVTSLWLGRGLVAGGLIQSGITMYSLGQMAANGQMPFWAAIAQGMIDGIQSGVQPGLHAIRGAKMSKSGLPVYRSKALQIGEMIFFGTPLERRGAYRAAYQEGLYRQTVEKEFSSLKSEDQKAFTKYVQEKGIHSSEAQLDLLVNFQRVREKRPDTTFESFGRRVDYDMADKPVREQYDRQAMEETKKGTSIADMKGMSKAFEAQAGTLGPERQAESVHLLRQAAAYEREAGRRQEQADSELRSGFLGRMAPDKVGEGGMLVFGRHDDAMAYGPKHAQASAELATAADQVVRGVSTHDEAKLRVMENLKKKGIAADPAEVDAALRKLCDDPKFIQAARQAQPVNGVFRSPAELDRSRNMQLERALEHSQDISGMEPPVMLDKRESYGIARNLGLHEPARLAAFARDVVLGNSYALHRLGLLPKEIRTEVEILAHDHAFRAAAMADDMTFERHHTRLRSGKAQLADAAKAIEAKMPPRVDEVIARVNSVASPADRQAYLGEFAKLHGADRAQVVKALAAQAKALADAGNAPAAAQKQKESSFLAEYDSLIGRSGEDLEVLYGLQPGTLADIYRDALAQADPLVYARTKIADKLGVRTTHFGDEHGDPLFGILLSGRLANMLKEAHPDAVSIDVKWLGESATGAFMVKVTEAGGKTQTRFVKKVNMGADKMGSDHLRMSGIPAAEVIIHDPMGKPLTYTGLDGKPQDYGISSDIANYAERRIIGGQDISLKASQSVPLEKLSASPELMDIFINHPDVFWKEYGFLMAAQYAAGSIDGHDRNVFAMLLDVESPTPEKIAALQAEGYHVLPPDASGNVCVFRLGRIDTDDAAGTYWAEGYKGNFDFSQLTGWLAGGQRPNGQWGKGHVLPPSFEVLAKQYNNYHLANTPGFVPISMQKLVDMTFGSGGSGLIFDGMKKWFSDYGSKPEYRNAMAWSFYNNKGQSVGVSSFKLGAAQKAEIDSNGITYLGIPMNGESAMPVYTKDSRGRINIANELVYMNAPNWQTWDPRYYSGLDPVFPHGKTVYVVEVPQTMVLPSSVNEFPSASGRRFAVYLDKRFIPPGYPSMEVTRHGMALRADPGFGAALGIGVLEVGPVHVLDYLLGGGTNMMEDTFIMLQLKTKEHMDASKGPDYVPTGP